MITIYVFPFFLTDQNTTSRKCGSEAAASITSLYTEDARAPALSTARTPAPRNLPCLRCGRGRPSRQGFQERATFVTTLPAGSLGASLQVLNVSMHKHLAIHRCSCLCLARRPYPRRRAEAPGVWVLYRRSCPLLVHHWPHT
jgi:hypothetical protein